MTNYHKKYYNNYDINVDDITMNNEDKIFIEKYKDHDINIKKRRNISENKNISLMNSRNRNNSDYNLLSF